MLIKLSWKLNNTMARLHIVRKKMLFYGKRINGKVSKK